MPQCRCGFPFVWAGLTSSDEFLPRSNMVQSVHVAFQKEHVRWSRNVNTVKRGQKMYRVRELGRTNHVKGMLCFNGSCWCCVNSKSLFACHNADVDFRSFGLALTSSDEFLPRSNMVQSVHVAFQKEHVRWSRNVNTVKRGQQMYRVRELGRTNHVKGMLCFNGSCWCCVNSKSLFACHNADVDFRSFVLA